ncbi:MAG: efflux RND transporter periplasmic adaptor subunit [Burkholderiales bacterium]|nr:efflux RND transporter periplasmic adaptor subunit [Burkholderiales bacterium]
MSTLHPIRRPRWPVAAATIAAALLAACGGGGGGPPQMPPPDVNVATVAAREVSAWDEYSGRVEAVDTVEIRPRVTGYLAAQHFTEGSVVDKGALLFTIDDREYRAAVDSAAANVARARTRVEVAASEFARTEKLAAVKAASTEEVERRRGEVQQAEADVKSAEAQLVQARLNLEFTRITAPIAGRVSLAEVKPGNLVAAGTTRLTTLVSIDPVYVSFNGDERMYLRYQAQARAGERPGATSGANPVRVGLADEQGHPHEGRIVFVDNAVDPATGTIRARAELANADGRFTPGLFARVQMLSGAPSSVLLVHERAILTDQDRKFVYVLGPGDTALRRDVTLGAQVDGLRVITSGLAAGEKVVVNGSRKIFFPGMPVKPFEVPMDQPELAPPAAAAPAQGAGG